MSSKTCGMFPYHTYSACSRTAAYALWSVFFHFGYPSQHCGGDGAHDVSPRQHAHHLPASAPSHNRRTCQTYAREAAKLMERCSDGVEDQAAKEASWGHERVLAGSRASGSAFSAVSSRPRLDDPRWRIRT
jgi:hypothetical protein